MKQVFNQYQLALNSLRVEIQSRIKEINEAERVTGAINEWIEAERDTLEGILISLKDKVKEINSDET